MSYPTLAPNCTWFAPSDVSITRSSITEINIVDSYTPTGNETASWDASVARNGGIMCYLNGTILTIAGNGFGKIFANADSSNTFSDIDKTDYFSALTIINGGNLLDTSNATTFERMFNNTYALTYVDVSNWDTSKVTSFRIMFQNAASIGNLDVSKWNTGKVTTMLAMFNMSSGRRNYNLTTLDVSNWDTSNVTTMQNMFACCPGITHLDVSEWDVGNVTITQGMFNRCFNLESLDLTKWNVSNVTTMQNMFSGDSSTNMSLTSIGDVNNWNVSRVTDMHAMFSHCAKLKELDVSNWNPKSCTDMSFMFYGLNSVKTLDVSNWDVSKVTTFDHMTAHSYVVLNGIENWTPSSVCTNMNAMFHSVQNTSLDVSKFNTSNVTVFDQMFQSAGKLTKIIGLENFNTANGLGFSEMFQYCSSLKELDLSSFDTRKAKDGAVASANDSYTTTMSLMFQNCSRLEKITLGENFSFNGDGTTTSTAHHAVLPTPDPAYISGADGNWYNQRRVAYKGHNLPPLTADTYYSSRVFVDEIVAMVKNGDLIDIADALRTKTEKTDGLTLDEMVTAIHNLNVNPPINNQDLTITENGIFMADAGYTGLGNVTVNVVSEDIENFKREMLERSFTSFEFPEGTTQIGSYAFSRCSNLTFTSLPDTVAYIGPFAFSRATSLSLNSLPNNLKTIDAHAFEYCTNIKIQELPDNLSSIGVNGFSYCDGVTITKVPLAMKSVTVQSFANCNGISVMTFHDGIVSIDKQVFWGCTRLSTITFDGIPDSINSLAFDNCTNLTTINVPWAEGEVANAPWGATNATINYNYVASS